VRLHHHLGSLVVSLGALAWTNVASADSATAPKQKPAPTRTEGHPSPTGSQPGDASSAADGAQTATEASPSTTETKSLRASLDPVSLADFESAMMLWDDGDFRGAKLKFQLVYDKTKDPRLLWNLAVCDKALRRYAKALPLVHAYLEQSGNLIGDAERQEAEALARAIENFVGPVKVESDQVGATVYIDDEEVGKTPLSAPLLLDMGDRKLTLRKRGFKEHTEWIRVLGPEPQDRILVRMDRDIPAATLEVRAGNGQWIWVDDSQVGRDRWEGLVSPGIHRVRVTGAGYKAQVVEVDLTNGGHTSVWVVARPLDPSEKGYLWPLVGALVTATAIVGVVAYYGLRPDPTRAEPKEEGRLDTIHLELLGGAAR
jgi:hypothetical protein